MSLMKEIPGWQLGIATIGASVFLLLVTVTGGLQASNWLSLHSLARGYTLVFVCAFAGVVLWSVSRDTGQKAVWQRPILLWLGYFPAGLALVAGLIALMTDIFTNAGFFYHAGWILAVIVLAAGVIPTLRRGLPR